MLFITITLSQTNNQDASCFGAEQQAPGASAQRITKKKTQVCPQQMSSQHGAPKGSDSVISVGGGSI